MYPGPSPALHLNRFGANIACVNCGGTTRHESWCVSINANVFYAYRVVAEPGQMTLHDRLILHSLGVSWDCAGCASPRTTLR